MSKPRSKKPKRNGRRARTTKEVARLEEFLGRADATRQERPLTGEEEARVAEARRMRAEILNRTPRSYRGGQKGKEGRGYGQPSGGIASTVSGGAPSVGRRR